MDLRFLEVRVENAVSDADVDEEPGKDREHFESEGEVIELEEGKAEGRKEVDVELVEDAAAAVHEGLELGDLVG